MARIFSKKPYSSLVYKVSAKDKLYLGINSDQKDISLGQVKDEIASYQSTQNPLIQKIAYQFKSFIEGQNDDNVLKNLFDSLWEDKNPIIFNIEEKLIINHELQNTIINKLN